MALGIQRFPTPVLDHDMSLGVSSQIPHQFSKLFGTHFLDWADLRAVLVIKYSCPCLGLNPNHQDGKSMH